MFSIVKYAVIASLSAVPADKDICCCFAFSANAGKGNIVCEEGGVGKAGQDMLFHQVAETSNACLARVGGRGGGGLVR